MIAGKVAGDNGGLSKQALARNITFTPENTMKGVKDNLIHI